MNASPHVDRAGRRDRTMLRSPAGLGAVVLALAACVPQPPCDRPALTASAVEVLSDVAVSEIRTARDAFYDASTRMGAVCVPSIRTSTQLDVDAVYRRRTGAILVRPDAEYFRGAVDHELCHAVQLQTGIDVSDTGTWSLDLVAPFPYYDDHPDRQPLESFAQTCHVGPLMIQLLQTECPADPDGIGAFREVLGVFDVPHPELSSAVGRWTPWFEFEGQTFQTYELLGARGYRTHPSIQLLVGNTETTDPQDWTLDFWSGQDRLPRGRLSPLPPRPPALTRHVSLVDIAGTEDELVAIVEARAGNGATTRRVLHQGPSGWTHLGCARPDEQVFAMEGLVGSVYTTPGGGLAWGVWSVHPEER